MVLTLVVALTAATCFALGNAVQHRAAGAIPFHGSVARMVVHLFASPQWLLGSAFAMGAFVLHTTAMNLGTVAVVQPFMLSAVLLAVPIRAFLDRKAPSAREMVWVAVTVAAIIVFVAVAHTERTSDAPHEARALVFAAAGFGLAVLWASVAGGMGKGSGRGFVFATASGLTFGVTAGLMKFMRPDAQDGLLGVLNHWHLWALLFGSILGTTLNQRSYQAARLSVVLPSMNSVDIVVAVAFGWVVFEEPPAGTPGAFVVQLVCVGAMALGLLKVAAAEEAEPHETEELEAA